MLRIIFVFIGLSFGVNQILDNSKQDVHLRLQTTSPLLYTYSSVLLMALHLNSRRIKLALLNRHINTA